MAKAKAAKPSKAEELKAKKDIQKAVKLETKKKVWNERCKLWSYVLGCQEASSEDWCKHHNRPSLPPTMTAPRRRALTTTALRTRSLQSRQHLLQR